MTDLFARVSGSANPQLEPEWVDEVLLAGAADDAGLHLRAPLSRGELRRLAPQVVVPGSTSLRESADHDR